MYLSCGVVEKIKSRGIPIVFTLHDYWLMCPQGQLFRDNRAPCDSITPEACIDCVRYQLSIRRNLSTRYALLRKASPGWFVKWLKNSYLFYSRVFCQAETAAGN